MTPAPVWIYELLVAPAALALAFVHARRALGAIPAVIELAVLGGYGYALERIAIAVFTSHVYGPDWRLAPGGVPLAVAACWAAVIVSAMGLAARLGFPTPLGRAGAAALIALLLDLLMEPVAVREGLWTWTPPGAWLGVPVGNFVGWAVIVGVYTWGAARWPDTRPPLVHLARRATLATLAVACLVAVGALWQQLGAERLVGGGRGWLVWGGLVALAAALGRRRSDPAQPARPAAPRVGAPGAAPALTLLLVATPFAAEAAVRAEPVLVLAVAGPLLALAAIARVTSAAARSGAPRLSSETASGGS